MTRLNLSFHFPQTDTLSVGLSRRVCQNEKRVKYSSALCYSRRLPTSVPPISKELRDTKFSTLGTRTREIGPVSPISNDREGIFFIFEELFLYCVASARCTRDLLAFFVSFAYSWTNVHGLLTERAHWRLMSRRAFRCERHSRASEQAGSRSPTDRKAKIRELRVFLKR